ncbi:hypothetical protein ACT6QH_14245 [Xanthobacter sp. TB0139]|uniref:hypothetical protein n=1 Tax=Xanthobacter sp. TB0139 TaxID=3459178 RepID=UPI0040390FFA
MIGVVDEPYVMLMSSLPALGQLLGSATPAITITRLEERLRFLSPGDRADLDAMASALSWKRIPLGTDETAYLAHVARQMEKVRSPVLRNIIRDRLEIRTLTAALRRRHAGEEAPAPGLLWGYGRHLETIRKNWALPDFGVATSFPWVNQAREQLEAGDTRGLERTMLQAAWNAAARYADGHYFDFEAVAVYVMRWNLADHWVRYDIAAATRRFETLLDAACGDILPETGKPGKSA